jgi:SulP family sulfate permease
LDATSFKRSNLPSADEFRREGRGSVDSAGTESTIAEDEEETTPESTVGAFWRAGPARTPDKRRGSSGVERDRPKSAVPSVVVEADEPYTQTESTPLLPKARLSRIERSQSKAGERISGASYGPQTVGKWVGRAFAAGRERMAGVEHQLRNPKLYTRETAIAATFASLQTLSAVFLGLLLNILDALSYGYILFPLGTSMFSQTGPDGISIFFVSCIVSQLCYSLGLSMFRGGVGSEMIEVVPFFHNMAYSIMAKMEGSSDEAIMATVIVSYCLSSIVTGLIFLALGGFRLGNLVSFFPRHILIGCIGGVGFFLVVTGIEVSARLEGNLNYDLKTLHKLFAPDTVYLWILPLVLAVIVIILRRLNKSPFVLPGFFIAVFAIFYIIVKGILKMDLEPLRNAGWIFEQPEAGVPFYRFYSYFSTLLSTDITNTADIAQSLRASITGRCLAHFPLCLHSRSLVSSMSQSTFPL